MFRSTTLVSILTVVGCVPAAPTGDLTTTSQTTTCEPGVAFEYGDGSDTCLDTDDLDGDGLRNCDDDDADGDGMRNTWDAKPLDRDLAVGPAAGFGADGALAVGESEAVELGYSTWLDRRASDGATSLLVEDIDALRIDGESLEGAEILVLTQQGDDAGAWQTVYVAEEDDEGTLTIEPPLSETFGAQSLVQRVPHYRSVTLAEDATLRPVAWSDGGSGVLMFRVLETLTVGEGAAINATGAGFAGGDGASSDDETPAPGESYTETLAWTAYATGTNNAGGGGAGPEDPDEAVCGGGGGYGSTGEDGLSWNDVDASYALGGETYGSETLGAWHLGSGGGGGSYDPDGDGGSSSISGDGGAGGGIVAVFAYGGAVVDGVVASGGAAGADAESTQDELGGGGGGSGGSLLFVTPGLTGGGSISSEGGEGGRSIVCGRVRCEMYTCDGDGGDGRIRVDTDNTPTTTIPTGTYEPGHTLSWAWEVEPVQGHCETDEDGDGFIDAGCGGDDCDDSDDSVHPGAADQPDDGIDSDCDQADTCTEDAAEGSVSYIHGFGSN